MCRNHRWFVEASIACSKLGAHAMYLNTSFAGPQVTEVCEREDATAIVYDEEFAELVERGRGGQSRRSWPGPSDDPARSPAIRRSTGPDRRSAIVGAAATPPAEQPGGR